MATSILTPNATQRFIALSLQNEDPTFLPVVQVINIKGVNGGTERYRTVLSDGTHFVQGMLASQLNYLVQNKTLQQNSIIRVNEYLKNEIKQRPVIIVLKIDILQTDAPRIGTPIDVEKSMAGAGTTANTTIVNQPLYNSTNNDTVPTMVPSVGHGIKSEATSFNPYGGAGRAPAPSHNPYGGGGAPRAAAPYGSPVRSNNPYTAVSSSTHSNAPIVRGGMGATSSANPITTIAGLNLYMNSWILKGRVTEKSNVRTWTNAKGEGTLFSICILDKSGVDIRGTFFKEAVAKFNNMLEVGKVYRFSGGKLKAANKAFNTCKSPYEITFDERNTVIQLDDDASDIQKQVYDFCKIADVEKRENGSYVDVIGIVTYVGDIVSLTSKKTGSELTKCDLKLLDDTGCDISVTLWGETAQRATNEFAGTPVVAFRRARVSDYGGKTLSAGNGIDVMPDIPEAHQLIQWWQQSGSSTAARSLSSGGAGSGGKMDRLSTRKNIAAIRNEQLGWNTEKGDYISFQATIVFLKKDKDGGAWYPACPNANEPCKNRFKVTETADGSWQCDKCHQTYAQPIRRWIFSGQVEDPSGSTWVSFFNEQGEALFNGKTADEVYQTTHLNHDQDAYDSYFLRASYTEWIFKCKVKQEAYEDQQRTKTSVVAMHPVDYLAESKDLLDALKNL